MSLHWCPATPLPRDKKGHAVARPAASRANATPDPLEREFSSHGKEIHLIDQKELDCLFGALLWNLPRSFSSLDVLLFSASFPLPTCAGSLLAGGSSSVSPPLLPSRARTEDTSARSHRLPTMPATLLPDGAAPSAAMRHLQGSHHGPATTLLPGGAAALQGRSLQPSLLPDTKEQKRPVRSNCIASQLVQPPKPGPGSPPEALKVPQHQPWVGPAGSRISPNLC